MSHPDVRFWFRLAWQLGHVHPDGILSGLDPRQYAEVMAFAGVEPLDVVRGDYRNALACLVAARAAGSKRSRLRDFLLESSGRPTRRRRQTPAEMKAAFRAINAAIRAEKTADGN